MIKATHAARTQTPTTDRSLATRLFDCFHRNRFLQQILEDQYIPYRRVAPKTARRYRCELGRWVKLVGDVPIHRIDERNFFEFREKCQAIGLATSSTEGSVKVVRFLLRFARDRGWIRSLPIFGVPLPLEEPEPQPATLDELGKLYGAVYSAKFPGKGTISPSDWWRAFLVLEYWTGIRGHDLAWKFSWRHIHEDCIRFRASKTGKRHVFPLPGIVRDHLKLVHGFHDERVFSVRILQRINDEMAALCSTAGIRKLTTNHIREACFTQWTLADETAGKLVHGCGIPRVLRRHYLGRLQVLEAAAERFKWPKVRVG